MNTFANRFNFLRLCPYSKRGSSNNRNQGILEYLLETESSRIVAYKDGYTLYRKDKDSTFISSQTTTYERWVRYDATFMDFSHDPSILYYIDAGKLLYELADNSDVVFIINPESFHYA